MSIFKKRGVGLPSVVQPPEHQNGEHQNGEHQIGAGAARKHEVKLEAFSVLGRPFLAPKSGGALLRTTPHVLPRAFLLSSVAVARAAQPSRPLPLALLAPLSVLCSLPLPAPPQASVRTACPQTRRTWRKIGRLCKRRSVATTLGRALALQCCRPRLSTVTSHARLD
jgi:hypothetical protein